MKILIKKIIRILLILMVSMSLLTACTYKVYASSAAGVIVAGGSIGTGGASVGLLGMLGPVAAILGVALASYGIYVVLDEAAEEAGTTKTDFLYQKFSEYNEARNMTNEAMQDLILEGASVLKNGAISISNSASAYINGFINYMYGAGGIMNPDDVSATVDISGFGLPIISSGETFFLSNGYPNAIIYDTPVARNYAGWRIAKRMFILTDTGGRVDNNFGNSLNLIKWRDGLYYVSLGYDSGCPFPDVSSRYSDPASFLNSITGSIDLDPSISESTLMGDETTFNSRAGTLSPSAGENTVFTPPLVGGVSGSGTISVPDYLDAINSLLNTGAADVPIADPVTGVESMVTVTDIDLTDTVPDLDTVEEQETIGTTVVVDPDLPITPDTETVNSLTFDLREIFPFCIPFDIYNLLSKFVAEPEAPHWDISIPLPLNMPAIEFEIDLSDFEPVGVVLRSFEMVLFVTSLAVATRSIYLRG